MENTYETFTTITGRQNGPKVKKKTKHNYTSELELKSLLIRIKNARQGLTDQSHNSVIDKYIKWHTEISATKYEFPTKKNKLRTKLKNRIVSLSEVTSSNKDSYERFGHIVLLMIKNILRKPQFSGYTYRDDFYSDAIYKILKYLHNFNHNLISERSGQEVNAFAYISQIIHNSIIYIINTKKKENDRLKNQVQMSNLDHNLQLQYFQFVNDIVREEEVEIVNRIHLTEIDVSLYEEILALDEVIEASSRLEVIYPHDYSISFDEYDKLKNVLKGKVSIIRETI